MFDHLNHISEKKTQNFDVFFPPKEKKTNIITYIRNMYKVKKFVQTSSRPPVYSIADAGTKHTDEKTLNKIISFNIDETEIISTNACRAGSRFGPTLYFIACCAHVIDSLNRQKNKPGDLWLPVPYDGRLKGAAGPLISNCVSFLFYRLTKDELNNVPQTVKCLSDQMKVQIKAGIPQKYTLFLNMMRHIPLWLYYFLVSRTGKGVFSSFLYTSTGDNFNDLKSLFGEPLNKLTMTPALTFPPGLTFVFLKHDQAVDVNIAYSPEIISHNELLLIEQKLKEILLNR